MTKRVLYAPCFTGELGWELINYAPHVNYVARKRSFDEVIVATRIGREFLYPMATHCHGLDVPTVRSSGNAGYPMQKFDIKMMKRLKEKGYEARFVDLAYLARKRYVCSKNRKFIKYRPSPAAVEEWSKVINKACIVFCIRSRVLSPVKNWSNKNWIRLRDQVSELGYIPVLTGTDESLALSKERKCINLIGRTSMEDMIAIFSLCKLAVGQSTGTMHLASLCEVPHVVWGPDRIRERYVKTWNPHKTPVAYYAGGGNGARQAGFFCSVKQVVKMTKAMLKK